MLQTFPNLPAAQRKFDKFDFVFHHLSFLIIIVAPNYPYLCVMIHYAYREWRLFLKFKWKFQESNSL